MDVEPYLLVLRAWGAREICFEKSFCDSKSVFDDPETLNFVKRIINENCSKHRLRRLVEMYGRLILSLDSDTPKVKRYSMGKKGGRYYRWC